MKHIALAEFWEYYEELPDDIQKLANKKFELLKSDPYYPSLHFKKVGGDMWSARVSREYCAVAFEIPDGFAWFWIGSHSDYERIIK